MDENQLRVFLLTILCLFLFSCDGHKEHMAKKRIELKQYQCYYEDIYFEPTDDIYLKAILINATVDSVKICEAYKKVLMNVKHPNGQSKYIYLNVYDNNLDFKFRINSYDDKNKVCSFSKIEFGSD